jgi:predicted RNA-binding protein associated with RNAse of E/G family
VASTTDTVRIHYRRPPNREEIFVQRLVLRTGDCTITLHDAATVPRPMRIRGDVVLEPGSPIVWFTFDGAWHDVGRFHRADGTFTGCYANVLTPVRMAGQRWETTDLFLDVWLPPEGHPTLLDESELTAAVEAGVVDAPTALRARREADRILEAAARGEWPPPIVAEWTLSRVRSTMPDRGGTPPAPPV